MRPRRGTMPQTGSVLVMLRKCIDGLRKNLPGILLIALLYGLLIRLDAPCLFQYFFHIPCPGCGMTRAVLAALHFDLASAFAYHPMFWSLPVIAVLILTDGRPTENRRINLTVIGLVAGGFLISYIVRLSVCLGL